MPAAVATLANGITAIAGGSYHSLAIRNGAAYAWGLNAYGQLGDGTTTSRPMPVGVNLLTSGVTAIAGGDTHSLAIQNGAAYAWGDDLFGQLGIGSNDTIPNSTPIAVVGLTSGVTAIAAGGLHSLAIQNGAAYAWGANFDGELGDGNITPSARPVPVPGLSSGVTAIAGGYYHSLAIQNGIVYAWGDNNHGQLGNGATANSAVPEPVQALPGDIVQVAAGAFDSYALGADGTLWAWGYNAYGELGLGDSVERHTPQQVITPDGCFFTSVSVGAGGGFAVATVAPAPTGTMYWSNSLPGVWAATANWTPTGIPATLNDVHIDPSTAVTVTGPTANTSVRSLTLGMGGANATLQLGAGGLVIIKSLILAGVPDAWTAQVDVTKSFLIVGTDPDLPNQLRQGAGTLTNGGNLWDGTAGITSSSAQAASTSSTHAALGYATGAEFTAATGLTLFAGQPFNPTDTLIMYTLAGDANMDGKVDISDFFALAGHIHQPADWSQGDFNYSGDVDISDFFVLTGNFGNTVTAGSLLPATTAAPEPASILLLACGLLACSVHRRRKHVGF